MLLLLLRAPLLLHLLQMGGGVCGLDNFEEFLCFKMLLQ